MIKTFNINDLGAFLPNEWSNPDYVLESLVNKNWVVKSMWGDDGMVLAVMAYHNYWGRNWIGFFLISESFKPTDAPQLKEYILQEMEIQNAARLQTESQSNPVLRYWHKFMGFELEGTRTKMIFDKDYDMYAIMRDVK